MQDALTHAASTSEGLGNKRKFKATKFSKSSGCPSVEKKAKPIRPTLKPEEMAKLRDENKCFICHQLFPKKANQSTTRL